MIAGDFADELNGHRAGGTLSSPDPATPDLAIATGAKPRVEGVLAYFQQEGASFKEMVSRTRNYTIQAVKLKVL